MGTLRCVSVIVILALALGGCGAPSAAPDNLQPGTQAALAATATPGPTLRYEIQGAKNRISPIGSPFEVPTDNCGSPAAARETLSRSREFVSTLEIEISETLKAEVGGGAAPLAHATLGVEIGARIGVQVGQSETIVATKEMETPAHSRSTFRLQWEEVWSTGTVSVRRENGTLVDRQPFAVLASLQLTQVGVETGLCATATPQPMDTPVTPVIPTAAPPRFSPEEAEFLDELSEATWGFLSSSSSRSHHLPWSWRSLQMVGGDYANPAEIGLSALSWLAAYDLGRPWSPQWPTVEAELTAILDQLRAWQTGSQAGQPNGPNAYANSLFYQWYWIGKDPPVVGGGEPDHLVPSIDNAWLAVSLVTIREYALANGHDALAGKAGEILAGLDFSRWYDPAGRRFFWGTVEQPLGGSVANTYADENRLINFTAYALGQMTADEFRSSLEALYGSPGSYERNTVEKTAWDGSYFTYTAPALFIAELDTDFGRKSIVPATRAQIAYAQAQGYPVWGLSDCYDIGEGGYIVQGAPPAAKPEGLEMHPGVVAPHVSALALITPLAPEALANLQKLRQDFPQVYDTTFGFYDSVMVKPGDPDFGQASLRFSTLGHAWTFLALANAQNDFVGSYFYRNEGVQQAHEIMYGPQN